MPGVGMPTLRGVGAAPWPHFPAPQSSARLRDGGGASLGHLTVGGTWHCRGACGDGSPFPDAVLVPLRRTAAGWGHGHSPSPPPRGTAPAGPYRLELGLVVLGQVAGLVDVGFVPGLGHKRAPLKPRLPPAIYHPALIKYPTNAPNPCRHRLSSPPPLAPHLPTDSPGHP